MSIIPFKISARDGAARTGQLELAHGIVNTPAFMPVGTAATVKGMLPEAVATTGANILLGNVYHLMLRPGAAQPAARRPAASLTGRSPHVRHRRSRRAHGRIRRAPAARR